MDKKTQIKLVIAIVGIITVFLPWYSISIIISISRMGIQTTWGIITFLGLGGVIASLFVAEMKKFTNLIAIAPVVTTVIGLLSGIKFVGFGIFLSLVATIALLAFCWMNKEAQ